MASAVRAVLTQDVLMADREFCHIAGDVRGEARVRSEMRLLAELPDGFEIERVRVAGGGDARAFELALLNQRCQPRRLVGTARRYYIGRAAVMFSTPLQAHGCDEVIAISVMLRLAAA